MPVTINFLSHKENHFLTILNSVFLCRNCSSGLEGCWLDCPNFGRALNGKSDQDPKKLSLSAIEVLVKFFSQDLTRAPLYCLT